MRKIFSLLAVLMSLTVGHAASYTTDDTNYEGKIVVIKAVIYGDADATDKTSPTEIYLYNGEEHLIPYTKEQAETAFKTDPYRFYWVISKAPSTASTEYYYLSSLNGGAYIGATSGKNLHTGDYTGVTITSTDSYESEFPFLAFDKSGTISTSNTAHTVVGTSLRFNCGTDGTRWLAVSENGDVNWINYTTNLYTNNGVKWTTNLEFTEVKATETIGETGSLSEPTHYGFKVTLTRSDDSYTTQTGEDYNYYGTLKLPYAVELPSTVTAYSLSEKTNVSNAALTLVKHENKTSNSLDNSEKNILARETPVILCMTHTEGDEAVQKTIYLQPEKAQTITDTGFKGSLRKTTFTDYTGATDNLAYYILTKKNGRVAFRPMNNSTINANKAYYVWENTEGSEEAKPAALSFIFSDDETTSIQRPAATAAPSSETYYDLTGRPVKEPKQPGIYIRNNRKLLVR